MTEDELTELQAAIRFYRGVVRELHATDEDQERAEVATARLGINCGTPQYYRIAAHKLLGTV